MNMRTTNIISVLAATLIVQVPAFGQTAQVAIDTCDEGTVSTREVFPKLQ